MPRLITKVLRANEFWVFLVIAALTLVIQARSGQFYTANNLVDLAGAMVVPGLFAVAAHLVLVSGGIDVSFPALASLAVYVTTKVLVDNGWNGPVIVPFLIAAALGAILGAFNGIFTSRLTVPTLIITLGTANVSLHDRGRQPGGGPEYPDRCGDRRQHHPGHHGAAHRR